MTSILWYFFRAFGFGSTPTIVTPAVVVRFPARADVARLPARADTAVLTSRGAD